jgi:poly-gamma-glutamate capsule biosynthesis protein CapA/YwtB (metallophosphatase superfamily)
MKHWMLALAAVLPASAAPAAAQDHLADFLVITGRIDTGFDGISSAGITASINGEPVAVDEDGRFEARLHQSPYYQVRFEDETIHTAIQTFGIADLYRTDCECLRLPAIEVVARKEGRTEVFFAGDAMAGRRYSEPIWGERALIGQADPLGDITYLLAPLKPYIETADLSSVNLEIVLSQEEFENSPPKSVIFYAPPALAQALKDAGFDHVSLGNNHSYDYLEDGLVTTIEAVEAAGLAWSGAGFNEAQALEASRMTAAGQDFCLLGYVGWKGRVEPNQIAETTKGGAAYGSDANIAASISREAATGCTVIAQYHGSREYSEGPTEESERRMKLAVDKGAALIASHHPHVAHGLELYNGALIAYSTGNFLFDQYFLETHGSFALRAWMEDGKVIRAEVIPIRVLDYRPVPAVGSMREAILDRIERLSANRGTYVARNGAHGLILPGATSADPVLPALTCGVTRDLFRAGDFENAVYGDAVDRSLKVVGGEGEFVFGGVDGHLLELDGHEDGGPISLSTSTFLRVLPSNEFTVMGRIRSDEDIRMTILTQSRPSSMGRFEALEKAPFTTRGEEIVRGEGNWQQFEFHFALEQDTNGIRPFRPKLMFSSNIGDNASPVSVQIDDLQIRAVMPPTCVAMKLEGAPS